MTPGDRSTAAVVERSAGTAGTLRVVAREEVADGVVAFTFADADDKRLPPWTPGSHIDLVLPVGSSRQYSLCGDRWDSFHYRIAVLRDEAGRGGSRWLHENLAVGDELPYGGPRNQFPMVPADEYLFVAGGIGITALLPMVQQAVRTGHPWRLLYGGRRRSSMAFVDELVQWGDRVDVRPEDESGLLDVSGWLGPPRSRVAVYCCGPAGLLQVAEQACGTWPPYALRTERFVATEDADAEDRPFTLRLRSGPSVEVPTGLSTLDALKSLGANVLSSCRQGTCGTCEVTVLAGVPDHRDSVLGEADRAAGDCMLVCVSRSRTDILTLDI